MLESEGLQTWSLKRSKRQEIVNQLQFSQILLQHRETQLLLIISRFQWPKNQSAPVQQKYVNSILRSVCVSSHHEIFIAFWSYFLHVSYPSLFYKISLTDRRISAPVSSVRKDSCRNSLYSNADVSTCCISLYFLHQHVFC